VRRVIEEIRRNYERYGITLYRMLDPAFTVSPDRCEELCTAMAGLGIPLRWTCYALVQDMPRLSRAMAEAGCRGALFGIESGDEDILRRMRKPCSTAEIHEGIEAARSAGITTYGSFFVGYPGETQETVGNTVRFILQSSLDFFRIGILRVDRNSPMCRAPEEPELRGQGIEWEHATADAAKASEWAFSALLDILRARGPHLGMDFGISPLVRAGLDFDEAMAFQKSAGYLMSYHTLERWSPGKLLERGFTPQDRERHLERIRTAGERFQGRRSSSRMYKPLKSPHFSSPYLLTLL
jgi:hypothetical protein